MTRNLPVFRLLLLTALVSFTGFVSAQNVDLESFKDLKKKKLFKVNGGISANTILYNGNGDAGRAPFTYYVNGSINLKIGEMIDLPFSFNLTNVGGGFNYPVLPNRLSVHPKYKSVTGHIGDVSMTFSPYTLNGYQFRGAGLDLEPKGALKISAMAGQLQRAVEYDSSNRVSLPSYKRFGYGAKVNYVKTNYKVGMIVFAAKDQVNSLVNKPDSLQILPKQNLVVSWNGMYMPAKNLELSAEYATSALTRDLRDTSNVGATGGNVLKSVYATRNSTSFYKAIKANLNYKFKNSLVGVGYERIDPGYQTLGAYYFNNDLENITVNFAQPFYKEKGHIAANFGYQRDDLDGDKLGSNSRAVGSVNVDFMPSQKLFLTAGYSNFQTYMYIKPLFQSINQQTQFQNVDTLNFSQISQNANFNANYTFQRSDKKSQSFNVNISMFD
ncbi:MAG TPA: hypothetical protein VF623_03425, partial [Segetibacter sp.]